MQRLVIIHETGQPARQNNLKQEKAQFLQLEYNSHFESYAVRCGFSPSQYNKTTGKDLEVSNINKVMQREGKRVHEAIPMSSIRVVQTQATFINDEFFMLLHYGPSHVSCMI